MSATKLYTNYAMRAHRLTVESAGPVYVDGIQSVEISTGLQTQLETGDGRVAPTFGSLVSGEPRARFSTNDIKALLDLVANYTAIDSDGSHPGISFYGQAFADGGDRSTALAQEYTFGDGLMMLRTIEASHRGTAVASAEVLGKSTDGAISPVVFDEAATLPAAAAQVAAIWTLGKVDLNGTQLEGVESMSINMGVRELAEAKDSDIYPTFVPVLEQRTSLTVRASHIDITSLLTEDGLYFASGVVVYLRKRAEGGTFVIDATAEHISFALGKCRVEPVSVGNDPKMIELRITPWDTEAGAAQVVIDTAAAIV